MSINDTPLRPFTYISNNRPRTERGDWALEHAMTAPVPARTKITLYDNPLTFHVYSSCHTKESIRRRWDKQRARLERHATLRVLILEVHQEPDTENHYVTSRIVNTLGSVEAYLSRTMRADEIRAIYVTRLTRKLMKANTEDLSENVFLTAGLIKAGFPVFHCYTQRYTHTLLKAANFRYGDLQIRTRYLQLTEPEPEVPSEFQVTDYDQDTLIEHVQLLIRIGQHNVGAGESEPCAVRTVLKRHYEELQMLYPDPLPQPHPEFEALMVPCQH